MSRNRMGNRGGRGQGPRPFAGGSGSRGTSSGPLMTGHLQLHDLDLELALLKRKRELIEKQQTMLAKSPFSGSSQLNFDKGFGSQFTQAHDFSDFYENAPGQTSFGHYSGQGAGVKRSANVWDQGSAPKRFNGPRARPAKVGGPGPAAAPAAAGRPPALLGDHPRSNNRPDFKSSKVTKPKYNAAPPNRLNSYPLEQRKQLLAPSVRPRDKMVTIMYEAGKTCSPKLIGRLELALGSILREMREQHGSSELHSNTLASITSLRAIKQGIRERIHAITIGTKVGSSTEIVKAYRKVHPENTDIELLDKVVNMSAKKVNELSIDIVDTVSPEKFFKLNFSRLLNFTLFEMFDKLKQIYTGTGIDDTDALRKEIDELQKEVEKGLIKDKPAERSNESQDGDNKEKTEGPSIAEQVAKETFDLLTVKNKFYEKLVETMLKKTLPVVLPKYKEILINLFDADEAFKNTKAYLLKTTDEKAEAMMAGKGKKTQEINVIDLDPDSPGRPPYYVKVTGRPCLPSRQVMKDFLDTFHPMIIKKHKSITNILFVAFEDKSNMHAIVEKSGTVLENYTLEISVSDKIRKKKDNPDNKSSEDNTSFKIDQDMDKQISELLSSIRGENENNSETNINGSDKDMEQVQEVTDFAQDVGENDNTNDVHAPENAGQDDTNEATAQDDQENVDNEENGTEQDNLEENVVDEDISEEIHTIEENDTEKKENTDGNEKEENNAEGNGISETKTTEDNTGDAAEIQNGDQDKGAGDTVNEEGKDDAAGAAKRRTTRATAATPRTRRASRLANN